MSSHFEEAMPPQQTDIPQTRTKTNETPTLYSKNDLDFSNCSPHHLKIIADNGLMTRIAYPKLVAALTTNTYFDKWYSAKFQHFDQTKKIQFIISTLAYYNDLFGNADGQIDISSVTLWKCIVFQAGRQSNKSDAAPAEDRTDNTGEQFNTTDKSAITEPSSSGTDMHAPAVAKDSAAEPDASDTSLRNMRAHEGIVVQKVDRTIKPYKYWARGNRNDSGEPEKDELGNPTKSYNTRKRSVWVS